MALLLSLAGPAIRASEDFNVLEAASLSASGEVELFGMDDPLVTGEPVPFRQVLDEALRNTAPQFSLESDFSEFTKASIYGKSMDELLHEPDGNLSQFGQVTFDALRIPTPEDVEHADFTAALLREAGYSLAADLHEAVERGRTRVSPQTLSRWIEILDLHAEFGEFNEKRANPSLTDHAADRFYRQLLDGLARSMVPEPPPLLSDYSSVRASGIPPDNALRTALSRFLDRYAQLTVRSVQILLERNELSSLVYGASELGRAFGTMPVSRPRFVQLDKTTQLARILLEGDYALKSIPFDAALSNVPGYRTFPDWAAAFISPSQLREHTATRYWVTVETVEIRESLDGQIAQFGDVRMKIESRSKGIDEPWSAEVEDSRSRAYAQELTRHYDELARRIPALHNLREAAKLVALANWIRSKGIEPRLDAATTRWDPPEQVEGFLAMMPYLKEGKVYWGVWPSGGVDFDLGDKIVVTPDATLTLEELRKRSRSRSRWDAVRGPLLERQVEQIREELERTRALEESLAAPGSNSDLLAAFVNRTRDLRDEARQATLSGLQAATTALVALVDEAPQNPEGVAILRSLEHRAPGLPPPAALQDQMGALPESLDEGGATAPALEISLRSWIGALEATHAEDPGSYEAAAAENASLDPFLAHALGGLIALSLFHDLSRTLHDLGPALAEHGDAAPPLDSIVDRLMARLASAERQIEALAA